MESASSTAQGMGDYANGQINSFLNNVEDLTKALKDVDTPDIARVRTKVKIALAAAQSALTDGASQLRGQAQIVGKRTDGYVRENPWQVVGIAAAIGLVIGLMAFRGSDD